MNYFHEETSKIRLTCHRHTGMVPYFKEKNKDLFIFLCLGIKRRDSLMLYKYFTSVFTASDSYNVFFERRRM